MKVRPQISCHDISTYVETITMAGNLNLMKHRLKSEFFYSVISIHELQQQQQQQRPTPDCISDGVLEGFHRCWELRVFFPSWH